MMKSPTKTAMAVRTKEGEIEICDVKELNLKKKCKLFALPFIRGVVAFIESMINGYKALMLSAEKSGFTDLDEDEKPKTEKEEKKQNALVSVIMIIGAVLGVALSVFLFIALPHYVVVGLEWLFKADYSAIGPFIEQFIKLAIFVAYVWAVSFMKDIKRTFMYHGAEHKTIFCFEKGLPLTVENVRKQKRFHPRCGTSFMILMILLSAVISTIVKLSFEGIYELPLLWITVKILLIPLTCGVGYEVLKLCGRYDNIVTKIISAPGLWLQRITTKEPDDGMIEIAIAALNACNTEEEKNDDI